MKVRKMPYYVDGRKLMSEKFYAVFADHNGTIRRLPLFESRKAADSAAKKIEELVDLRAANATLPPELSRWVESMPPEIRDRLAEYGILSTATAAGSKSLGEHLDDWRRALTTKGNGADYVDLVAGRASDVFTGCGFKFWSDLCGEKVQEYLAELRRDKPDAKGISAQTSNFYLQAAKQFCKWMIRARRATDSPLAHLQGQNVKTDRRHDRRAFAVDELLWLLKAAEAGPERFGMSGIERSLLYRLAVETGLRRGGLEKLTKSSFDLDGDDPAVIVKAGASNKYKAERRVPLKAETAEMLRVYLAAKMPDVAAFKLPPHDRSAKMVRADLDGARAQWLASSPTAEARAGRDKTSFLLYKNPTGQYLDFHALRHTRGVWLFEHHKAHPREVQELMGVSSLALVDRYTRSFRLTDLSVIERGPDLSRRPQNEAAESLRATGTDNATASLSPRLSPNLSPGGGIGRGLAESGELNADSETRENVARNTVLSDDSEKPPSRVELETAGLQNRCSAN